MRPAKTQISLGKSSLGTHVILSVLSAHLSLLSFNFQLSRKLKLKNLPQCDGLSGGAAVELLARGGNPLTFLLPQIMTHHFDCNFSFSGLLEAFLRYVAEEEQKQGKITVKFHSRKQILKFEQRGNSIQQCI